MLTNKHVIVVVGPTAIGKTALAINIARHFHCEIVSADSRQFYREMSIGTAKPSLSELATINHHFIDSHSIKEEFTVGDFEQSALEKIEQLFKNHDYCVVVGGSGLFINAITEGFDNLPKAPANIRHDLNLLLREKGIAYLQERLKDLDPDYFYEVDLQNPQRIIRALEVCISSGRPFSSFRTSNKKQRSFNTIKIGLNTDRERLYSRINQRVDLMIESGLIDEVRSLLEFDKYNALNTVGYVELFDYLKGKRSLEDAIAGIKQNTRRFAKRQLTWFRRDQEIEWFEPDQLPDIISYIYCQIATPEP